MQERKGNLSRLDRRHTDFPPGRPGIAVVAVRNTSARWCGGEVESRQYLLRKLLKVLVVRSVPEGGGSEVVRRDSLIIRNQSSNPRERIGPNVAGAGIA